MNIERLYAFLRDQTRITCNQREAFLTYGLCILRSVKKFVSMRNIFSMKCRKLYPTAAGMVVAYKSIYGTGGTETGPARHLLHCIRL